MIKSKEVLKVLHPKNQLNLYGYSNYFNDFIKLYKNGILPKVSLISGYKGLGKSTFIYHLVNCILSTNDEKTYSTQNTSIDPENKTFKLISSNIHPNFMAIDKLNKQNNIGIEEIRNLLFFLNKTTFLNNQKFVMIDKAEYLNINSANALLKNLEDPSNNTHFFIIYNNQSYLPPTIKSRSIEFRIFFNFKKKKEIFLKLLNSYKSVNYVNKILDNLHFDTPGNLLRYYLHLDENVDSNYTFYMKNINLFIDKYKKEKDLIYLYLISLFVEKFYKKLILSDSKNNISSFVNRNKIISKIYLLKKFNLDEKNIFSNIEYILANEKK